MIIFNSPSQEEKTTIPDLCDFINHTISKNEKLIVERINDWTPESSKWVILSQNDELYKLIDSHTKPTRKFSGIPEIVKIGNDVYSYCHGIYSNPKKGYWNFIDKFSINKKLCISDPCYLNNDTNDFYYLVDTKDEFYAFCYMEKGYVVDVMIINTKMFHDSDGKLFNLNIKNFIELKVLGVDAGCITFCECQPFMFKKEENEDYDKWYENEVCYKCYNKAYPILPNGIIVSSGYGDGWYSLMKYENKELDHLAYYINFTGIEDEEMIEDGD